MPTLLLRFPARRYHATPWGHHVNEGLIEWPPSPWRLLRALLSVGYTSGVWNGAGPSAEARSLVEKLASVMPCYHLPGAVGAHSRHYMPIAKLSKGREDTTLVFDTWAQIEAGELAVTWKVELTDVEKQLLGQLAERLGYLGRSESWVAARLTRDNDSIPVSNCMVEGELPKPGPGWEQVALMAPETSTDYARWRAQAVSQLPSTTAPSGRKGSPNSRPSRRKSDEEPYPEDIIACLQRDTSWLRRHGWSQPPGSRRVFYWRKVGALEVGAPALQRSVGGAPAVTTMLLSLATPSGNEHALPSVMRVLPQAELLHRSLVHFVSKAGYHSRALTGCDENGKPLSGPHSHAHLLMLDLDSDGNLDHVLIWAPMGLDHREQNAVRAVRRTYTKGGIGPLRMALAGLGSVVDLSRLGGVFGDRLREYLGLPDGARVWRSVTPFVPPRFLKQRGRNSLFGQVEAELAVRGFPAPAEIRHIDPHEDDRARRQRHFIRTRRSGPLAPLDCGFTFELRFESAVQGPLCLGYGSHFGLGLFTSGT